MMTFLSSNNDTIGRQTRRRDQDHHRVQNNVLIEQHRSDSSRKSHQIRRRDRCVNYTQIAEADKPIVQLDHQQLENSNEFIMPITMFSQKRLEISNINCSNDNDVDHRVNQISIPQKSLSNSCKRRYVSINNNQHLKQHSLKQTRPTHKNLISATLVLFSLIAVVVQISDLSLLANGLFTQDSSGSKSSPSGSASSSSSATSGSSSSGSSGSSGILAILDTTAKAAISSLASSQTGSSTSASPSNSQVSSSNDLLAPSAKSLGSGSTGSTSGPTSIVASLSSAVASAAVASAVAAARNSLSNPASSNKFINGRGNVQQNLKQKQQHQLHQTLRAKTSSNAKSASASSPLNSIAMRLADSIPEVPYSILHNMKKLDHAAPFYNVDSSPVSKLSGSQAALAAASGGGTRKELTPLSSAVSLLSSAISAASGLGGGNGLTASNIEQLSAFFKTPLWRRLADGAGDFAAEFRSFFRPGGSPAATGDLAHSPSKASGVLSTASTSLGSMSTLMRELSVSVPFIMLLASKAMKSDVFRPTRTTRKSFMQNMLGQASGTNGATEGSATSPLPSVISSSVSANPLTNGFLSSIDPMQMSGSNEIDSIASSQPSGLQQAFGNHLLNSLQQQQQQQQPNFFNSLIQSPLAAIATQGLIGHHQQQQNVAATLRRMGDLQQQQQHSNLVNNLNGLNLNLNDDHHRQPHAPSSMGELLLAKPDTMASTIAAPADYMLENLVRKGNYQDDNNFVNHNNNEEDNHNIAAKPVIEQQTNNFLLNNNGNANGPLTFLNANSNGMSNEFMRRQLLTTTNDDNNQLLKPVVVNGGGSSSGQLEARSLNEDHDDNLGIAPRGIVGNWITTATNDRDGNGNSNEPSISNKLNIPLALAKTGKYLQNFLSNQQHDNNNNHNQQQLQKSNHEESQNNKRRYDDIKLISLNDKHRYSLTDENNNNHNEGSPLASPTLKGTLLSAVSHIIKLPEKSSISASDLVSSGSSSSSLIANQPRLQQHEAPKTNVLPQPLAQTAPMQQHQQQQPGNHPEQRDLSQLVPQSWKDAVKRTYTNVQQSATTQWRSIEGQVSSWLKPAAGATHTSGSSSSASSSQPSGSGFFSSVGSAAVNMLGFGGGGSQNKQSPSTTSHHNHAPSSNSHSNDANRSGSSSSSSSSTSSASSSSNDSNNNKQPAKTGLAGVASMIFNTITGNKSGQNSQSNNQGSSNNNSQQTTTNSKTSSPNPTIGLSSSSSPSNNQLII